MKCSALRLLTVFVFSVCSVFFVSTAKAYPAPRSNFSNHSTYDLNSVKLSRSSRDTSRSVAELPPLSPGSHNLSIGVGQVFLMGSLSSNYENSLGTNIHYTYGVSDLFSFESDFGYSSHSNGNFSLVNLGGALRTNLVYFDQLIPFASVGLGFYRPSKTMPNNATLNALLFGMEIGGGVDLLLSRKMFFGTRLSYHNMFDSSKADSSGTLVPVGGSFLSFMIHAGVTF